jgi:hypothetical protein
LIQQSFRVAYGSAACEQARLQTADAAGRFSFEPSWEPRR